MTDESPRPDQNRPGAAARSGAGWDEESLSDSMDLDESLDDHGAAPHAAEPPAEPAESQRVDLTKARTSAVAAPAGRRAWWRRNATKAPAKPHRKAPWWELPVLVIAAIVIAVLVKSFVIQPFYIPSQSMENTLYGCPGCSGDRILVNKVIFDFRHPEPGDIVVFHAPDGWDSEPATKPPSNPVLRTVRGFGQLIGFVPPDGEVLVKRVIAVGGQTVRGVTSNGGHTEQIEISDHGTAGPWRTLDESSYVDILEYPDPAATFGPVTVPKGRLWVMGDHRNESADSRYHCGDGTGTADLKNCNPTTSTVPLGNVIGKAFVVAWPPKHWRTLGTPKTFHDDTSAAGQVVATGALPLFGVAPLLLVRRRRRRRRR